MSIDFSVYPDVDETPILDTDEAKADYIARICGAWDFGIIPLRTTFDLFAQWQSIFDAFPLSGSPAYHAFRAAFSWEPVAGTILEADYERMDRRELRVDPCLGMI